MNRILIWLAVSLFVVGIFAIAQTERGRILLHLIATGERAP